VNHASAQRFVEKLTAAAPDRHVNVNELADFDTVYEKHVGFVWRTLRGMGVPDSAVEDAVQEVFVVVHRRLADFDGRYAVRTWLFAIVYRVACEQGRRLRRMRIQEPLEPQLRDSAPSPYESAERAQELRVAVALLDALDDDKRAVIVLADVEGMTAPEIAEATGVRLNTVYTRLRRARLELNKMMIARGKRKP
jgi:RNA polymerase sigma-70 factor (ECF subfamily)